MSTPIQRLNRGGMPWRKLGWSLAAVLLALPFIAMQLQVEGVNWTLGDFVFAAVIFGVVGGLVELGVRASANTYFRAGVTLAVLAGFALIWVNAAVGLLGSEQNDANLLFLPVPVIALAGSAAARFRPSGMALAMIAAGGWLLAVPVIAYGFAIDEAARLTRFDYPIFLGLFAAMWFGAAALLARAARVQPSS